MVVLLNRYSMRCLGSRSASKRFGWSKYFLSYTTAKCRKSMSMLCNSWSHSKGLYRELSYSGSRLLNQRNSYSGTEKS
jgi:hypothetical protein